MGSDAAALVRRVHAARFERTVTLEEFDFGFNPGLPAAVIRDLATLRFLDAGESVVLHGPVGVGKTMVAQALGHAACRRGHAVLFTRTSRLLADLAGGHADRTFERRLRAWARPALLILDDFAMREFSAAGADDLYELVTERAGRSLVITANRAASDWYPLFPNPVVAESILDQGRQQRPPCAHGRPELPPDAPSRPTDRGARDVTAGAPGIARICARPGCGRALVRRPRGRPPIYCSAACRGLAHRKGPVSRLTVEVDAVVDEERGGRPVGHAWLVRMARGDVVVEVATGLGRPLGRASRPAPARAHRSRGSHRGRRDGLTLTAEPRGIP